jgi:hypothetical protein
MLSIRISVGILVGAIVVFFNFSTQIDWAIAASFQILYISTNSLKYIQGVSGGIVNILEGGIMDYSE